MNNTPPKTEEDTGKTNADTLEIRDLDHFIGLLTRWHTHKVDLIKKLHEIPETASVSINDGEVYQVTGDFREGFKLGLSLALSELGSLPFVAELEDSATAVKH